MIWKPLGFQAYYTNTTTPQIQLDQYHIDSTIDLFLSIRHELVHHLSAFLPKRLERATDKLIDFIDFDKNTQDGTRLQMLKKGDTEYCK